MFSCLSRGSSFFGKMLFAGILNCFLIVSASAQNSPTEEKDFIYKQDVEPMGLTFYDFSAYYYNGKRVYNLFGEELSSKPKVIKSLKINPSGTSYSIIVEKGRSSELYVYDLWKENKLRVHYSKHGNVKSSCYTPDSKQMFIATDDYLYFYNINNNNSKLYDKTPVSFVIEEMTVSPDSRHLASYNSSKLVIWNLKDKTIVREFDITAKINDVAYSNDGGMLAVLTDDGILSMYETSNYYLSDSFESLGDGLDCSFHPDGKHVSVVTADNHIAILNLTNKYDRNFVDSEIGGVRYAEFVKDGKNQVYLCYNTKESIVYDYMDVVVPQSNYKLLSNELNDKMDDWMKMMPGESLEDYNLRMSEENKEKQMRLFEQEISTKLAENLVQHSEVSFGNYSPERQMLALNFDTMPPIYLDVPQEDVNDFMNPGMLTFQNEKYILGQDEKFELTYAEIYNQATGKQYVFDNQERMSLDFLQSDDNFIPLNFVQQSNMEEIKLQEIKDEIVSTAKQNDIISDHTNISVNTKIIPSQDADGNRINNYNINFSYEVESGFSVHEDFAPGKYKIDDSGAAQSMVSIIKTALETEFSQYVKEGKKLQIVVTGMADALQINNRINYDGTYGDFIDEPVYKDDVLNNITVTRETGITQNEQLAFLRAVGVKEFISNNVSNLGQMDVEYRYNINLTSGTGGEFRRITVDFTFIDAFIQ